MTQILTRIWQFDQVVTAVHAIKNEQIKAEILKEVALALMQIGQVDRVIEFSQATVAQAIDGLVGADALLRLVQALVQVGQVDWVVWVFSTVRCLLGSLFHIFVNATLGAEE